MVAQRQREYVDNVTIKINANNEMHAVPGGGGVGDVIGPASATDQAFARFDGTSGKLIQNSPVTMDDLGSLGGALGSQENVLPFAAALSINARSSNVHRPGVITSDFTIAIDNALAGDCGAVGLTQDGTGGWKITDVTCPGFTVLMTPDTLSTLNPTSSLIAGASSIFTYQIIGTICFVSIAAGVTPSYL